MTKINGTKMCVKYQELSLQNLKAFFLKNLIQKIAIIDT